MINIASIPLLEIASSLRSGSFRLNDFLLQLEHIFNKFEPEVRAFVKEDDRFSRLRHESVELEARYPNPESRPPLYGVPIGVKDIIHVAGMPTSAGTTEPSNTVQSRDAEIVHLLREAGVLILGKTITTEYVKFNFTPGPTRNPHNLSHTPGGSSSGSAAAVAAGYCPLALGTQTLGSIIRPASYCGVVGYKPSYNRISCRGVISLSPSLDHVGLFATNIEGVTLASRILCQDKEMNLNRRSKPHFGIPEGPYLAHTTTEGLSHFRETCDRLKAAGFVVKSVNTMPNFEAIYNDAQLLMAAEAAQIYKEKMERENAHPSDLVKYGLKISQYQCAQVQANQHEFRKEMTRLMEEHDLDLWISPSAPGPAPRGLNDTGNAVMNLPWSYAGLPTLNIPSGVSRQGLPLGLQVTASWKADEDLLTWGIELEKELCQSGRTP